MSKTNYKKSVASASPVDYVGLGIDENGLPYIIDEDGNKTIIVNAVNDKGWFANPAALNTAYAVGEDGWFAIVGSTDTVWVWDSGTPAWVDTSVSSSSFLAEIQAAAEQTTLNDTDKIGTVDVTGTPVTKWFSLSRLKTFFKTYFDTLYNPTITNSDDIDEGVTNKYNKIPSGGTPGQVLTKNSTDPLDVTWATPPGGIGNIIANKGVGLSADKPVTGLTIGDIYVSTDSKLKFTATGATTWDVGAALDSGSFINDTSLTANLLYQYDGTNINLTGDGFRIISLALSDETTDLAVGTAEVTYRMPKKSELIAVRINTNTAPTGSSLIVDVNENGASVLSTKVSIDAGDKTSVGATTAPVISDASIADDSELTFDIDQVGATVPGKGLKITLYFK